MKSYNWLLIILFTLLQRVGIAQGTIDMAETMRSNGKIYVVVGVISIIFLGIIIYLIRLDSKISRIEKKINNTTE
jgi:predicted membrane channel-forming protein YqfA (hemolysin III family)